MDCLQFLVASGFPHLSGKPCLGPVRKVRPLSQVKINKRLRFAAEFAPITQNACSLSMSFCLTHYIENISSLIFQKHTLNKAYFYFYVLLVQNFADKWRSLSRYSSLAD
jgi:hypothetical protein